MSTDGLNAADFASCLDTDFTVTQSGTILRLTEVRELNVKDTGRPESFREPFSLVFSGRADERLAQGSFELLHATLGEQLIFLVPIQQVDSSILYEAVFG